MRARNSIRRDPREAGIALLISIFILLLISVVAISLLVSSGTESAIAGNYRAATAVYYAALAGLEEGRGRLSPKDPNSFKNKAPNVLPPPGTTFDIGYVSYVLNPGPTDGNVLATYPDMEYDNEFGSGALLAVAAAGNVNTTASIWNLSPLNGLPFPGPLYKWVRINAVSETSLNIDVDADGRADSTSPLYYDGTRFSNDPSSGSQVLEITSLAVLPNGSQKLLQYLAAPIPITLPPFLAALTLAGSQTVSRVAYTAPSNNAGFFVDGTDHDCNGNGVANPSFPAIGVFDSPTDINAVKFGGNGGSGIPTDYRSSNYPGFQHSPAVEAVAFPTNLQKPSALDSIVQSIIRNADVVLTPSAGPVVGSNLSAATAGMSWSNPMTVVINGDLDLTGWHNTGYGLLLVTGNLNYDPNANWDGIVLVIGQGTVTGSKGGNGEFLGAFLVASTRDSSGNLWPDPNLGLLSVNFNDGAPMGGNGIYYSSCWIQAAMPATNYRILSFHEISQ